MAAAAGRGEPFRGRPVAPSKLACGPHIPAEPESSKPRNATPHATLDRSAAGKHKNIKAERKDNGGPGAIRTPDPQIRSLTAGVESNGKNLQPAFYGAISEQWVKGAVQTATNPENENPGALAGATEANVQTETVFPHYTPERRARAIALADAAADCPDDIRARLLERLLDQFRPGWPIPAFMGRVMSEASFWADMASRAELKAYALACWQRMPPADRVAFIDYLAKEAA